MKFGVTEKGLTSVTSECPHGCGRTDMCHVFRNVKGVNGQVMFSVAGRMGASVENARDQTGSGWGLNHDWTRILCYKDIGIFLKIIRH